ncbi:dihydrodipicolinate synthase family protein [Brevibacterium album]|uniref:dihydrodipicolinate synthase family protein n=1 Tax=Brevibacterium album TaxID=417948 RepID=UPI000411DF14|nr:dihydrodipicolinate synthase family protein [Brevibacterium album]
MNRPIVITATPTLFSEDESLDLGAAREQLAWLQDKGVDAVFAAGTTGEFPALSDEERLSVLRTTLEVFAPERTYFHVGAAAALQAEQLARGAAGAGAVRLAAVTPYYQPAPEAEVLRYYERLVAAAPDARLYAYLFTARTSTVSVPALLPKLADLGVAGVKLSGESDESVAAYLAHRPEGFEVFSGNDISFGWLAGAGGDGIVSGVSSAFPEPFVALRDAVAAGREEEAARWQGEVERVVRAVLAGSLTHLKAGAEARGFRGGPVRSAVPGVTAEERAALEDLAAHFDALAG